MIKYETVDEYMEALNPDAKMHVSQLRHLIHEVFPNISESMSYKVPTFYFDNNAKLKDKIMIAGYKNHTSFYPYPDLIEVFKEQLIPYKVLKGTIQFSNNKELPLDLIKEMLLYKFK